VCRHEEEIILAKMSRLTIALVPLAFPAGVGAILFAAAGRFDLPFVWAIVGLMVLFYIGLIFCADPQMMRERLSPGPGSRDHLTRTLGSAMLVGHWVLVGLDVGRFQWSLIPWLMQVAGLGAYLVSLAILFWVMRTNPFYSSVVRVQTERGHYAVTTGPYRFVRHPGYAASLIAMIGGGLAMGSWVAMLPLAIFFALFIRRTLLEDRLLRRELPGYADYAQKVRYRLVNGIF
jgi:protein-S-isoprenylcysteine O-methyltransferase Ste14